MALKNFMLDLETMGTKPNSPIVAIGVAVFDESGIHDTFECNVDLRSYNGYSIQIDPDTVLWWMKQSEEARRKIYEASTPLPQAIEELTIWMRRFSDKKEARVWGNGAGFDCVMLRENCSAMDMSIPWEWWNDRCYRTMKNLYPDIKLEKTETAHTAVGDAIMQASHLVQICRQKGVKLG